MKFDFFDFLNALEENRAKCKRLEYTEVFTDAGKYCISTMDTPDAGLETAIWREGGMIVVVAHYKSEFDAIKGHNNWVEACRLQPAKAWSVQLEEYVSL